MGKLSKAQRRNARITRDVLAALKRRPPGPRRPMTRDWVIRLRDLALVAHGGTRQQTLNLVDRVVKNHLSPTPRPRIRKCTVTGGRNLELAIASLVERDQPPAELLRSLRRVGVTKLSPRSAITLHAKALPRAIELRAQREARAARALRRKQDLCRRWVRWYKRLRKLRAVRAAKRHTKIVASRWERFAQALLTREEEERREAELAVYGPLWRTLVKGIIESPGFQEMWNSKQDLEWQSPEIQAQLAEAKEDRVSYDWLHRKQYAAERREAERAKRKRLKLAKSKQTAEDRKVAKFLKETAKLTRPESTVEDWAEARSKSKATKRPRPRTRTDSPKVRPIRTPRSRPRTSRWSTPSILHPVPY